MEAELRKLQSNAKAQRKFYKKTKETVKEFNKLHPDQIKICTKEGPGRPNVELYAPGLGAVLQDIVNTSCNTNSRRRDKIIYSVRTLDDLHRELRKRGWYLSRSATYLRILPRNPSTNEGKKHIHTIPVRIFKPQEDEHKEHISTRFCRAEDRQLRELASYLGPCQCNYIGMDDKAKFRWV